MVDAESLGSGRSGSHCFPAVLPIDLPGTEAGFFDPRKDAPSVLGGSCFAEVLDELDYGILVLVDGGCHIASVNHAAEVELDDDDHPLLLTRARLETRLACDRVPLRDAVHAACWRGCRRLLMVGKGPHRASVSIVPLRAVQANPSAVLVILGKRVVCETLSMAGFCHAHGLTLAENRVLSELCAGTPPKETARRLGVSITTVRTQIQSMRMKTGAPSIGALLARVATLPPLRGVLRSVNRRHALRSA